VLPRKKSQVAPEKIARGVVASLEPEKVAPHDKKKKYKNNIGEKRPLNLIY
jgi:hypothetical protein